MQRFSPRNEPASGSPAWGILHHEDKLPECLALKTNRACIWESWRAVGNRESVLFCFVFNKFIYLFIFSCVGSSLLCSGFLYLRRAGATLHCGAQASHCGGFSCCGARALGGGLP